MKRRDFCGRPRSTFQLTRKLASVLFGIAVIVGSPHGSWAQAPSTAKQITFTDSIREPVTPAANSALVGKNTPAVVRSQLTNAEMQAVIDFSVALKMRNLAELQQRTAAGEVISLEEMGAKYFPTSADAERVRKWLLSQGFEVLPAAQYQLSVFARGTVAQLQHAFSVTFGRVQFAGEEHTSAITAPSLPADVAGPVLSVNGLQPHLHPVFHSILKPIGPSKSISNQPPYLVPEIAKAYNASIGSGAGQKIGIVIDTFPADSDLTTFWADNSVPQSLSNIEKVQVVAGSLPAPSGEETLDVSWSSGIASAAKVRIYATTDLAFVHLDQAYQSIINDLSSQAGLRQVSLSFGLGELFESLGQMQTDSAYFASLAGNGVTVFVSSGDGGNSPSSDGHHNTGPVQTEAPANDPNVTAVGGTSLTLDPSTGAPTNESAWSLGGGGESTVFSRPIWQPGSGTIPGTGRLVPDVALAADPNTGAFLVLGGLFRQIGGTSWSSPVWAGFCARLNQIRASTGDTSIGLLGPDIYPYLGSAVFRDITTGSNGYNAGPGFDLCTGLGVPQVDGLISVLSTFKPIAKDFNGDGFADLVFENSVNGRRMVWLQRNGVPFSSFALPSIPPSWHIAGVGDFLGNGQSDLVFENTVNGRHLIWILQNGVLQSEILLPPSRTWHVVGAGDFNGDGKADLVLENPTTGHHIIWMLNGGVFWYSLALPAAAPSWHIAGVGDFLGNGQSDLVLENKDNGRRQLWILNHGALAYRMNVGTIGLAWHIGGTGDFFGNGQADLVLENTFTGRRMIWVLNNGFHTSTLFTSPINAKWHIVSH
jgi:kumamolisin